MPAAESRSIRPIAEQTDSRPPPDAYVAQRAAAEWSVLSLDELRTCGLSPDQVTHRLKKGWLHRVYPAVYAVGHPSLSMQGRLLAAVKSIGRGAVLSHFSAAALWGFVEWDDRHPEMTVPRTRAECRSGIRVHRTSVLDPCDVTRREGIPVTSAARTLVDLAAVVNYRLLRRAVRQAQSLRLVNVPQLVSTLRRLGARRGARNLNRILATGPAPTRTELEDMVFDLILDSGLTRPDVNKPLLLAGRRLIPDFRWPEQQSWWRPTVERGTTTRSPAKTTPSARPCWRRTASESCGSRGPRRSPVGRNRCAHPRCGRAPSR